MYWRGDLAAIVERTTALRAQAMDLGDLYSATNLSIGLPSVTWLVRGDAAEGRRAADEAMERWSHRSYHLQHYWHAYALAQIELYQGDPMRAWQRMREAWRDLGRALLRGMQMIRIEVLWARGRAAVATAALASAERDRMLRDAARMARALRGEKRLDATVLALAVEAGIHAVRGEPEAALERLTATIDRGAERELGLIIPSAALARGRLIGGDRGAALTRDAEAALSSQGVADPAAFSRVFLPGFT
jgi:hypothetical protein